MVFPHRALFLFYLVIFALVVGCSGGGGETPTSPDLTETGISMQVNPDAVNNTIIWETGEVILDTEELEATVVPLRTTDFTLNIVKFLQPPAGDPSNLGVSFDIANSDFANAYVDLDLTLTHPFPGTMYWGFDVRVIVFGGGSTVGKEDTSVSYPTASELRIVNADGYTRWWNRDEFGPFDKIFGYTDGVMAPTFTTNFSIVNGYKYFAEGIGAQTMPPDPAEADRGVFPAGSVTREMQIQFPQVAQPFKFKYSVSASWNAPDPNPPTSVDDFEATANQQEAYQVVVIQDPSSTAFYNPDDDTFGGDLDLIIEVWDWQAAGDPAAQISEIWFESQTLLSNQGDAVEITGTWTESAGSSPNSVMYTGSLTNLTPDAVDGQELFITVKSADPTTYEPPLSSFLYPDADLAAYQLFLPEILDNGTPPEKSITVTSPNGGETLLIDSSHTITWNWTGAISDVVIELDLNSGDDNYPVPIVLTTECDGEFEWDPIPDTPATTCKIRITEDGATPVQDESNNDFTISSELEPGWNPVPGSVAMGIDPEPNQSTVAPDFGIQNDNDGNEGAWMIDQEGGEPDGTPYFYDYLLDWSGPGGNDYPSGFNYNFAPFGRHDCSSNGITIFGCSANTDQMSPPVVNDPLTAIWYVSYILDDDATAGELNYVTWGDQGSGDPGDPPENDPDEQSWFHTCDADSGLPGWQGDDMQDAMFFLMCYSHEAGAPPLEAGEEGDLNLGFWQYPYSTDPAIYRLGFPDYTTDLEPPIFQAFDVTDPTVCRLACDSDSYMTFDTELDNLATMCYMLDSVGTIYGSGFQLDWVGGQFYYIGLGNSEKLFVGEEKYVEDALAIDMAMVPTITWLYEQDWEAGNNWLAVLFDTGTGWVVRIYATDWSADLGDRFVIMDTTEEFPGTPLAIDVDGQNFTIHVIADNGGTIEATVFDYTE